MLETIIVWAPSVLQILIAFGLINVWVIRFGSATKYRGASAHTMKEEFSVYGLPIWFMYIVGFFKIGIAITMLYVLFVPHLMLVLGIPSLVLLSGLMVGAITMHIKIQDPFIKIVPAIAMLSMSLLTIYLVV